MTDPVCGMTVPVDSPHQHMHDGEVHRFCSSECRDKFAGDPDRYLGPSEHPAEAAPTGTIYTCPMHPEVEQVGPGDCPKCGMALEPRGGPSEDDDNPELRDMTRRFWFAAALSIPLVIAVMADMLPSRPISERLPAGMRAWLELALATPVCLWAADVRCWPGIGTLCDTFVH